MPGWLGLAELRLGRPCPDPSADAESAGCWARCYPELLGVRRAPITRGRDGTLCGVDRRWWRVMLLRFIGGEDAGRQPTAVSNSKPFLASPLADHGRGGGSRHVTSVGDGSNSPP